MQAMGHPVDYKDRGIQANYEKMLAASEQLAQRLSLSRQQGTEKSLSKNAARGKLLARQRVAGVLDRESPFLELLPLCGYDWEGMTLGGSVVSGIGLIAGRLCLVSANVQTIKGGAINEASLAKSERLDQIARENRLPVIHLTESAGANLLQQSRIFNYGGRGFREITQRSREGIPTITGVFGSSTAGGAYIPGMSDYVVMVANQAKTYLAGPPLVKMAINEEASDEELGGAMLHARRSGLCDYLAASEQEALYQIRQIVSQWVPPSVAHNKAFEEPIFPAEDILALAQHDVRSPYDVREVIARVVDGSQFHEFKPAYGSTLVTGVAEIMGTKVGILANNGILFAEAANKGAHFIQLCDRRQYPLVFLQNTTGFMVGQKAEEEGIIKHGAKLINAVSNCRVPSITLIIGSSYGAGNYGMCGRAYNPRFLFSWPNSRIAVMGPNELAGVMDILAQRQQPSLSPTKLLQKAKDSVAKNTLCKRIEAESNAYYATGRAWDDGIIDPRDTRSVLGFALRVISQNTNNEESGFGVFRM